MTTQIKGYPFEIVIHATDISDAVLSDQVKNLDLLARNAMPKGKVSEEDRNKVCSKIRALLGIA